MKYYWLNEYNNVEVNRMTLMAYDRIDEWLPMKGRIAKWNWFISNWRNDILEGEEEEAIDSLNRWIESNELENGNERTRTLADGCWSSSRQSVHCDRMNGGFVSNGFSTVNWWFPKGKGMDPMSVPATVLQTIRPITFRWLWTDQCPSFHQCWTSLAQLDH